MIQVCSTCKVTKNLKTDFHKNRYSKTGFHQICKPCRIAYNKPKTRAWWEKNRERYNEAQRRRYRARKERQTAALPKEE